MTEEWRDVVGYEGLYQVSNTGKVRSLNYRRIAGAVVELKQKNVKGYKYVDIINGTMRKMAPIHRLVTEAFIGSCPVNKQVNHIDGDTANNNIINLEYVTASENIRHSYEKLGRRRSPGVKNGKAKINDEIVLSMLKAHYEQGVTIKDVSRKFGTSYGSAYAIIKRIMWKHVQYPQPKQ